MNVLSRFRPNQEVTLALLMLFQAGCCVVFVVDIMGIFLNGQMRAGLMHTDR